MTTERKTTKKIASAPAERAKKSAPAPLETTIFSMNGEKVGTIALPNELFSAPWKSDLVHQVTTAMQANARQNRAHTKDRSEVSGGGKKPWKQKGTGQARHSSSRSPLWRHGGVTFGPRKERDYSEKINRKMRIAALVSVLSRKAKDGEIILVDKLSFATPKTSAAKTALAALAKHSAALLAAKKKNAALVALAGYDTNAVKSFQNLGSVMTEEVRNINPVDVLTHKYLIIEKPEQAFAALLKRVNAA
ncbi:50S ribosomal protein L4 [Patescibacteria group bacterium]|nr:50S ribosomal protein L4 [Patescibacteria group bacterium]MDE2021513.1 50S ribosomal protein L4 [Patescibacteria group bacterium]MDE2173549.1 50S ribosomal protein L4 [Patescibacteria group bacterium]